MVKSLLSEVCKAHTPDPLEDVFIGSGHLLFLFYFCSGENNKGASQGVRGGRERGIEREREKERERERSNELPCTRLAVLLSLRHEGVEKLEARDEDHGGRADMRLIFKQAHFPMQDGQNNII